jgi:small-conductance mechanosensitive channel
MFRIRPPHAGEALEISMQLRIAHKPPAAPQGMAASAAAAWGRRAAAPPLAFLIALALWLGLVISAHAASAPLSVVPGTETSQGNALVQLQYDMLALKAQLKLMISSYPDLLTIVPFVIARITKDYNQGFIFDLIFRVIIIFVVSGIVEAIVRWSFRHMHKTLPHIGERSDFGKLNALLVHGLIRIIELAAFGLTAIVCFFIYFQGHEAARYAFWTLFSLVMLARAVSVGLRLILAPHLPRLRLPAIDDHTACRLYWHFRLVTWLTIGAGLIGAFLFQIGLSPGLTHAASTLVSTLGTIVIIVAISRDRRAIGQLLGIRPPREVRHDLSGLFAAHWHVFAICLIVAIWIFALVSRLLTNEWRGGAVFASMCVLVGIPLVDGLARTLARRFFGASTAEPSSRTDQAAPEDAAANIPSPGLGAVILRNGRIALAVLVTVLIGRIWHVSLSALGPEWLGSRVAEAAFQIIVTLLLASSAWSIIKIAINRQVPHEALDALALADDSASGVGLSRLETLLPLVRKFVFVTIVAIVLMSVVSSLGVNIGPLLAGAGVVGIAVGFGAQTLVRDILSGIFFLIDDAFRVGEYIDVGEGKGTVEYMSIRALMLRHQRGAVYTVPFGAVRRVANYSRDWSITKLDLRVPFDTDLDKVRRVVKRLGEDMAQDAEFGPYFLEPLKSQGVNRVDDSALVLRVKFMTRPNDQSVVQREVYRRLQHVFYENEIEFATRHVVVNAAAREAAGVDEAEAAAATNVAMLTPAGGARSLG